MDSFYKIIGLYDHLSFNIEMEKSDFSESLKKITYKTNTAFITLIPDTVSLQDLNTGELLIKVIL